MQSVDKLRRIYKLPQIQFCCVFYAGDLNLLGRIVGGAKQFLGLGGEAGAQARGWGIALIIICILQLGSAKDDSQPNNLISHLT